MELTTLLILQIILGILFVILGIRLFGKIIGIFTAFFVWILVGGALLGLLVYEDYKNYKSPTVYLKIENPEKLIKDMNNLNSNFSYNFSYNISNYNITNNLTINNSLFENKTLLLVKGNSTGKVYVDYDLMLKLNNSKDIFGNDKIYLIILIMEGIKDEKITFDPELKTKPILLFVYNHVLKNYLLSKINTTIS